MKSEKLLTTPNALVQAPGFDGIFVRHSPDDTGIQPHLVTQSASGKISYDCNLFKSSKICEHAVSFAQYNGKIEQFLEWRRKSKSKLSNNQSIIFFIPFIFKTTSIAGNRFGLKKIDYFKRLLLFHQLQSL
jgi:hypothetical protein